MQRGSEPRQPLLGERTVEGQGRERAAVFDGE